MTLVALVRDRWYPAWDAGDRRLLAEATRAVFAPAARISAKPGTPEAPLETVLAGWLREVDTWQNQRHVVTLALEEDDRAAWVMQWEAIHAGPLQLPDGRVVPATGATVEAEAAFFASWDGERIVELRAFSDYSGLASRLERLAENKR